jgi:hypothetical protein
MLDSCLQQAGVSASRFLDIDPKAAGQDDKLTVMLDLFLHLRFWILNPLLLEGMTNRIRANLSSRGVKRRGDLLPSPKEYKCNLFWGHLITRGLLQHPCFAKTGHFLSFLR